MYHFPIYLLFHISLSLFKLGRGERPARERPYKLAGPPRGDDAKNSLGCTELLGGFDPPPDSNQTPEDFSDVSLVFKPSILQAIMFENFTAFSEFKKVPAY